MIRELMLLLGLVSPDLTPRVAVEASYTLHTGSTPAPAPKCECVGGVITHGDGHTTPCPCKPCRCHAPK